jgi:hypothetical protein
MATKYDIPDSDAIFQGEAKTIQVTITGENITGWHICCLIARDFGDEALIMKTVGSGITITNGESGLFQIALAAADTAGLESGGYAWQVWRTDAGSEGPLVYGRFPLKPVVKVTA